MTNNMNNNMNKTNKYLNFLAVGCVTASLLGAVTLLVICLYKLATQ